MADGIDDRTPPSGWLSNDDACPRCGHSVHFSPTVSERLRRTVARNVRRMQCQAPTDLGPCVCYSRFHVR